MASSSEGIITGWLGNIAHGLHARFNNHNPSDDSQANADESTRTVVGRNKQQSHTATEGDRERRRNNPIRNMFSGRGSANDRPVKPHLTPSPERKTAGSDGKTLSPRPSTWASREAREARSARFQEDEMDLVDEIVQLIRVKTASPTYALKRLAALSPDLNDVYRGRLLDTAKAATEVAYAEYERARTTGWKNLPGDQVFSCMSWIPFAEDRSFRKYVDMVNVLAEDLDDSASGLGFFEAAAVECRRARESVGKATDDVVKGGAEAAQMVKIRWFIERKCMYWAAVAMADARLEEAGCAGGSGEAKKSSSGSLEEPVED